MTRPLSIALALLLAPAPAAACGGFFCGRAPVDQQAERIVFAVGETHTDMIVQIRYAGAAPDFAWVLPLGFAPTEQDMDTFPALALNALDANTAPIFQRPDDPECQTLLLNGGGSDANTPGVTVHIEDVVGPYEVVVIGGADTSELVSWLRDRGYRISDAMLPFVEPYVEAGMNLLALRLTPGEGVDDIEPFRIRMPTTTPSIPLRLTAVAAEPEMGLLVTILARERYGPSNWSEIEIDPATIRFAPHAWPAETNWVARVAREADVVGGMGFVTELAGPTAPIVEAARDSAARTPEQEEARDALVGLLEPYPYLTRLYARLSPEEMRVDPMFAPRAGDDVPRTRQLVRFHGEEDLCEGDGLAPCDFALCGGAACEVVRADAWPFELAACACGEGRAARATTDPLGQPSVVCVDPAASLMDPSAPGAPDDPCVRVDCGAGTCRAVNMTPTCACEADALGVGYVDGDGQRRVRCVRRDETVIVPPPTPRPDAGPPDAGPTGGPVGGGACSVGGRPSAGGALALGLVAALALLRRRLR